jgi:D-amino-acid oxidase
VREPSAIVLGAGVSGLTCAHALLDRGHTVRVVAARESSATTSAVAAAFWFPYRAEPADAVRRWSARSYEIFARLADERATGVRMRPVVCLVASTQPQVPAWARVADPVWLARADLPTHLPARFGGALRFRAPVVDTSVYLPWLVERLRGRGVAFESRQVESLDELVAQARLIVNTSGLGARTLCDDASVYGLSGQVVVVDAPDVDEVWIDDVGPELAYIVPRTATCVLGGTAIPSDGAATVDAGEKAGILARCETLVPGVASARFVADKIGVRPCRDAVRLEVERRGQAIVGHDYGHGGAGITLSWGCAHELVDAIEHARASGAGTGTDP